MIAFKDILRRITGVSVPIFGLQWTPPADQTRIAQQLLDRLSDRRVLYAPYYRENEQACLNSAVDLRQDLATLIDSAPPGSPVYKCAKNIQKACRAFMSDADQLDFGASDPATALATRAMFEAQLGRLRKVVGHETMNLVAAYGLDVEDELAVIIPFSKPE